MKEAMKEAVVKNAMQSMPEKVQNIPKCLLRQDELIYIIYMRLSTHVIAVNCSGITNYYEKI